MDKFDILINIYLFTYSVECSDGQSFVQTYINWLNNNNNNNNMHTPGFPGFFGHGVKWDPPQNLFNYMSLKV